jgi:radical SAM superfamily enzyme YgiQ (UPF0313 family)
MQELVRDMEAGTVRRHYRAAGRPDITRVPRPRWDLIDFRHYVTMAVQFSRGCPFDRDFRDIIVMNGRIPRTKSSGQLLTELEALRVCGWKDQVFIVDDNFIGDRARTKALLHDPVRWRVETRMRKLYEPRNYYRRIRNFLEHYRPAGPRMRLSLGDLMAFMKSLWVLGVRHRGRREYWRFFWLTLLRRPRQFRDAAELVVVGYHFRRVAAEL